MILIFPPYWLKKVDLNNYALNPKISSVSLGTDKTTDILQKSSYQPITALQSDLKVFAKEIAAKYGLDYEKFDYTIQNESGYYTEADNGLCVGVAQYTLDTWLGNCSNVDDRTDDRKAIECMAKMWVRGEQYRWDAYCFKYPDKKCIELRHLYPK